MFDLFRKHTKILMFVLVILVVPAFILVGMGNYGVGRSQVVATIAGSDITQEEWDNAQRNAINQVRAANPDVDMKSLDTPLAKYQLLEKMVRDRLIQKAVQADYLSASNAQLVKALEKIPAIATLRLPDGRMDMQKYRQLLESNGTTPAAFEGGLRYQLSINQLTNSVTNSAFAPSVVLNRALDDFFQQRDVAMTTFDPASYLTSIQPTEQDLQNFYNKHTEQFKAPASADVEYVVLDINAIKKGVMVSDADAEKYFNQNAAQFQPKQERRISNILIAVPSNASPTDVAKIKAKAEGVLLDLKKHPDQFATVAREVSDDAGSKSQGGDLGFMGQNILPPAMNKVAFSLADNELSPLIQTNAGFNILKVTDIRGGGATVTFADVRASLIDRLQTQEANQRFSSMSDTFAKAVYAEDNTYRNVSAKLNLPLLQTKNIQDIPNANTEAIFNNPAVLRVIFDAKSIAKKQNSDVIQVAPNTMVSVRVTNYRSAHILPFLEVRSQVEKQFVEQLANQLAEQAGKSALKTWQTSPHAATWAKTLRVSRAMSESLDSKLVHAIMSANVDKLPCLIGVNLSQQGYVVVKIEKVAERVKFNDEQQTAQNEQFTQILAEAELEAYLKNLGSIFKVKINVPPPAPMKVKGSPELIH